MEHEFTKRYTNSSIEVKIEEHTLSQVSWFNFGSSYKMVRRWRIKWRNVLGAKKTIGQMIKREFKWSIFKYGL